MVKNKSQVRHTHSGTPKSAKKKLVKVFLEQFLLEKKYTRKLWKYERTILNPRMASHVFFFFFYFLSLSLSLSSPDNHSNHTLTHTTLRLNSRTKLMDTSDKFDNFFYTSGYVFEFFLSLTPESHSKVPAVREREREWMKNFF